MFIFLLIFVVVAELMKVLYAHRYKCLKWSRPCVLFLKLVCTFVQYAVSTMRSVRCVLRPTLCRSCKPASFVRFLKWNVFTANGDELTCRSTVDVVQLDFSRQNVGSSKMTDAADAAAMQSRLWKRMISFKRKLLGDSSVLSSSVLNTVTAKSRSVFSQQSESVDSLDHCIAGSKHLKMEDMHCVTASDSTVVVMTEDCSSQLNASEDYHRSTDILEPGILPLFNSDHEKESSSTVTARSSTSKSLHLL